MTWTLEADAEWAIIRDLCNNSHHDRVIGIVGAAFLDNRLTGKLVSCFRQDRKLIGTYTKGSGPLASFSTKIDFGYLMGFYSDDIRKHLHWVREIRNHLAHRTSGASFSESPIRDLCGNLTFMNRFRHPDAPDVFSGGSADMSEAIICPHYAEPVPTDPRGVFVMTVRLLLGVLYLIGPHPPAQARF